MGIIGRRPTFTSSDDSTDTGVAAGRLNRVIADQKSTIAKLEKELKTTQFMLAHANRDSMTDLSSRNAFVDEFPKILSLAVRSDSDLAVVMVDLDDLKKVNDSKGHIAGDSLIKRAATAIKSSIRNGDFGYRYGGDEFVILLMSKSRQASQHALARLRKNISAAGISCSIGLAMLKENSDMKPKEPISRAVATKIRDVLVNEADKKMYEEKNAKDGHVL